MLGTFSLWQLTPDMTPDTTLNMTPDTTPSMTPDTTPGMTPGMTPDMNPSMTSDMTPGMTPDQWEMMETTEIMMEPRNKPRTLPQSSMTKSWSNPSLQCHRVQPTHQVLLLQT